MKIKEKKTEPTPINCVCGKAAAVTVFRGKKNDKLPEPRKMQRKPSDALEKSHGRSCTRMECCGRFVSAHRAVTK